LRSFRRGRNDNNLDIRQPLYLSLRCTFSALLRYSGSSLQEESYRNAHIGLSFTLFIMGIAAAEAAIALGIIILIFRKFGHIEGQKIKEMKD